MSDDRTEGNPIVSHGAHAADEPHPADCTCDLCAAAEAAATETPPAPEPTPTPAAEPAESQAPEPYVPACVGEDLRRDPTKPVHVVSHVTEADALCAAGIFAICPGTFAKKTKLDPALAGLVTLKDRRVTLLCKSIKEPDFAATQAAQAVVHLCRAFIDAGAVPHFVLIPVGADNQPPSAVEYLTQHGADALRGIIVEQSVPFDPMTRLRIVKDIDDETKRKDAAAALPNDLIWATALKFDRLSFDRCADELNTRRMGKLSKAALAEKVHVRTKASPTPRVGAPKAPVTADSKPGFTVDREGKLLPTPANIAVALTISPVWKGTLGFNLLTNTVFWADTPAYRNGIGGAVPQVGADLRDHDIVYIGGWLERTMFEDLGGLPKGAIWDAVIAAAHGHEIHPIRAYLDGLVWDGTPRLDRWLTTYLGAADTCPKLADDGTPVLDHNGQPVMLEHVNGSIGRWWMLQGVARVKQPGCKADYTLVLEGPQGAKKSGVFEVLGGEWYSATMGSLQTKESAENLNGVWLMELAELDAIRGSTRTKVKEFLTKRWDRYRPAYGRTIETFKRQCVFAASTNEENYLSDDTGNRRFWPVRVGNINLAALTRDRDQLWAEALVRYEDGAHWWPSEGGDERDLAELQEDRFAEDAWQPIIAASLSEWQSGWGSLTTTNLLKYAVNIDIDKMKRPDEMRVAGIMGRLGYYSKRETVDGKRERRWLLKDADEAAAGAAG
jgi:hypothetical protein